MNELRLVTFIRECAGINIPSYADTEVDVHNYLP